MQTLSPVKRLTTDSFLLVCALLLTYVEHLLPLNWMIPIPGFKVGLANLAVLYSFFYIGEKDALGVSFLKIVLTSLLFGSIPSFLFSLSGGAFSFMMLLLAKYWLKDTVSFVGISIGCAALHNTGQILAACLLFREMAFIWYLPWLLLVSIGTGCVTGILLQLLAKIIQGGKNIK